MTFTSTAFILFFAVVLIAYYLVPRRFQWVALLLASAYFYCLASPAALGYIIVTIFTTYATGMYLGLLQERQELQIASGMAKKDARSRYRREGKCALALMIALNLGILAYMKYTNMFIDAWSALSGQAMKSFKLAVPLGISFYTFMSVGYAIDVFRLKIAPERSIFKLALFTTYFPHITQGPISRYGDLAPQLTEGRAFDPDNIVRGFTLLLWGYVKKLVLADRLAVLVRVSLRNYESAHPLVIAACIFGYAIQIYADFSGYMDIVGGFSEMLGIKLAKNFDRPYFSRTIAEFWRRWHITMGAWFRDYMFYPMSTSAWATAMGKFLRKKGWIKLAKQLPIYVVTMLLWLATGLWHGATWGFVAWGVLNGLLIVLGMATGDLSKRALQALRINPEGWAWKGFQILRTFVVLSFVRMLSRAATVGDAFQMFGRLFTNGAVALGGYEGFLTATKFQTGDLISVGLVTLMMIAVALMQNRGEVRERLLQPHLTLRWATLLCMLFMLMYMSVGGTNYVGGFIYAQF